MPISLQEPPVQSPTGATYKASGPTPPPDRWWQRLGWGLLASVAVNAALWPIAAQVVHSHVLPSPPPITFRRIILPPLPKHPPKPTPKNLIRHVVKPKPPPVVKRQPVVHRKPIVYHTPIVPPKPIPVRRLPVTPLQPLRRPTPPAAHQRIVTAKGSTAATHTALPGDHAPVGVPTEHQIPDKGHDVTQPPLPQPTPTPQPPPAPQPPAAPPVHQSPLPAPVATKPPLSTSVGQTRDAQPTNQAMPEIPDELKSGDYQSHVRVKVEIASDGNFSAGLVTSSGNEEIDRRVLDALKHWKWKPALKDGQPVASTARFRFDFEVQ